MWMLIASAVAISSSLETSRAPAASAFSAVRFWLQAITFIRSALA